MTALGNARRKPAVAARRAEALRLRQQGHSYAHIADELQLKSAAHARTDVARAMRDVVREAGTELVNLERDRLDRLQVMAWTQAEQGDTRAMRELVRIMERRARLLGLDEAGTAAQEKAEAQGIAERLAASLQAAADQLADQDDTTN